MARTFADVVKGTLAPHLICVDNSDDDSHVVDDSLTEYVPWDCLPYNVLVKVCWFLHEKDRGKMSAVCKSWNQAAKNPRLWRSHVFYLYSNLEAPRGLSWLNSRVQHLRHATIMCFGQFERYRDKFMRALQHANLFDLDINGTAYWWAGLNGRITCSKVVARIVRLLKTQRRLRGFQMRQAMLDFTTGMGVLDALAVSSGENISRLGLEDFFGDDIVFSVPAMPERFTRCMMKFPNLNDLTINYEYLTDNLLYWLSQCGKGRIIYLNIVSWLTNIPIPIVSRRAWSTLSSSCGEARVYLILQNIRSIREVINAILLPEIPMYRLDLVGVAAMGEENVHEMVSLLQHVTMCYSKTLDGFRLWSDNDVSEEIEESLLNLLKRSSRLQYLDLHMDVQSHMMGTICEMHQKNALKLNTLRIARSLTDFVEFENFRREVKTWFPVLKELKLDFHIRAESAPNHSAWNEYVFIIADTAGIVDSEEDGYYNNNNSNKNNNNYNLRLGRRGSAHRHRNGDNQRRHRYPLRQLPSRRMRGRRLRDRSRLVGAG